MGWEFTLAVLDQRMKNKLKIFRLFLLGIDPGIMRMYYRFFYQPKPNTLEALMDQKLNKKGKIEFIQVGGNDGYVKDPIFKFVKKYRWKGIIAEPQDKVFHQQLKKTYRFEKNVVLENVAIADKTETKKLYKIGISEARWATGLATFNKDVLIKQIQRNYVDDRAKREGIVTPDNIEDYITYEEVHCSTIVDLLDKHNLKNLELVQIDTEGYDFEIIKTIPFNSLKPRLISFENEHLSEVDFEACKTLLQQNGYELHHIDRDSLAVLKQ